VKTKDKIITLAITGLIAGTVITFAWAMAWGLYIIFQ
jgi:hypothetical protein